MNNKLKNKKLLTMIAVFAIGFMVVLGATSPDSYAQQPSVQEQLTSLREKVLDLQRGDSRLNGLISGHFNQLIALNSATENKLKADVLSLNVKINSMKTEMHILGSKIPTQIITLRVSPNSFDSHSLLRISGEITPYYSSQTLTVDIINSTGTTVKQITPTLDDYKYYNEVIHLEQESWVTVGDYTVVAHYNGASITTNVNAIAYIAPANANFHIGSIQWLQSNYNLNIVNNGVIRVIDQDLNISNNLKDITTIDVWSSQDAGGIDLTLTETGDNTGIFEGTVLFTETEESTGDRLRIRVGDTVTAEYKDRTLPPPNSVQSRLDIEARATISK